MRAAVHVLMLALAGLAGLGCGDLDLTTPFPCSSQGKCPGGYVCAPESNLCHRKGTVIPDGSTDSAASADRPAADTAAMGKDAPGIDPASDGPAGDRPAGDGPTMTDGLAGDRPATTDGPATDLPPPLPGGRAPGEPCLAGTECKSGFCADGVCCNTACTGQCEACDGAGSAGVCKPVVGAPHSAATPARPPCGGDAACPGACDGTNTSKCVYPANRCRARSCSATTTELINEAMCNANGVCPAVTTTACPFACRAGACTACTPGTRQCGGPTTPQLCDNNGVWQNQACAPVANMVPVCNADGTCGRQCQPVPGGMAQPLACPSGDVCPVWAFETGTEEGWQGVGGSAWNDVPVDAVRKTVGGKTSYVLAVGFDFRKNRELKIKVRLCAAGTNLKGKAFSYDTYVEAPSGVYFSLGPQAWNGSNYDTPNGISPGGSVWVTDNEGFAQTASIDLQIVLAYQGDFTTWNGVGTAYFDNFTFK